MKRFVKKSNKKGFTLLEVMLAVAVMAISSTMIMEGFVATMNASRNTTVYSRVGNEHYQTLIRQISLASKATDIATRTEGFSGGQKINADFDGVSVGAYLWVESSGSDDEINVEPVESRAGMGLGLEDELNQTLVDNRAAFFYVPTGESGEMGCTRGHVGHFQYCRYIGGKEAWASWGYRCTAVMDEYLDGGSHAGDEMYHYCFQYG